MAEGLSPWPMHVRIGAVQRAAINTRLEPDAAVRKAIAKRLGLVALDRLEADIALVPWLDGAELSGWIKASVTQTCSITADPLDSQIDAGFMVRVLPAGSRNYNEEPAAEIDVEVEADDVPDLLGGDVIDVSDYVVEHLALELDPFPRKPGAVFEPHVDPAPLSPFAGLAALKDPRSVNGDKD